MPKQPSKLIPPYRGAANNSTYEDMNGVTQAEGVAPFESIRNVIAITPDKERPQVGTRYGLERTFAAQLPGAVQAFCTVERSSGQTGLQTGAQHPVVGQSRIAGTLTGHCFVLDATLSMFAGFQDPRALLSGAFNVAYHPTLPQVAFMTVYTKAGNIVGGLNMCDTGTRSTLWQADVEDLDPGGSSAHLPIFPNQIAIGEVYTFVAAASYIYIYRTDTGAYLKRERVDGWVYEVQSVRIRADGTLLAGFKGTDRPAVLPNQPALAQGANISGMFRSGVACFEITGNDSNPLSRIRYGPRLLSSDLWFESDHGYARFSEFLSRRPNGGIPYALSVGPNGEACVGITNQGWGWNNTYAPDGTKPYRSVVMLESDGSLRWEADRESPRVAYQGVLTGHTWTDGGAASTTYHNDIPQIDADDDVPATGTPKAGVMATAIDANGDAYSAGQQNQAPAPGSRFNVYKHNAADGGIAWKFDAGSMVEQHAIAVDPTDNNLWVAVMRNAAWAGHTNSAILIKLNTLDGTVLKTYDTTPAPTNGAWMVDVSPRGEVAFVVDFLH